MLQFAVHLANLSLTLSQKYISFFGASNIKNNSNVDSTQPWPSPLSAVFGGWKIERTGGVGFRG